MQPLPPRTRPHASPIVSRRTARSRKSGTVSLAKTDPLYTSARVFGSIRIGKVRFRYFRPQTADLCKRGFFASREFTNASTGDCKRSCFRSPTILSPPTRYSAMSLRRPLTAPIRTASASKKGLSRKGSNRRVSKVISKRTKS